MAFLLAVFLVAALVGLAYSAVQALTQWQRATKADVECAAATTRYTELRDKYNADIGRCKQFIAGVKAENERLSKWKDVADADAKAAAMLVAAKTSLDRANADAARLTAEVEQKVTVALSEASNAASAELAEAKRKAKILRDESQAALDSATAQAAKIVEAANNRAEEIAGSAYEAVKDASLYERTAKAMKNLVEGYGDQYIVPPHSLLDGLANDFGYTQAGRELKNARERTRIMVGNRTAAECDYVEAARRETAVNFVIDAFNGKVDSIMSRVKHDNVGKLSQQIHDAFSLVNYNGKAFRNARITETFLAARLDELKWAALAQELLSRQRDEQRAAKEQARDEARAARDRERALREAAKEEDTFRRAIQQAREQFEQASGEQKEMYEERIREMEDKLRQAQEKRQRAVSMAEQVKKGHVYILSNIGSFGDGVFKIGLTRRWNPQDRVDELGGASVPFGFDVHATILNDDAPALEQKLHEHFALNRVNKRNLRKEFFRASIKEIRDQIQKLGIDNGVNWTMTAQAAEYRETLAIEKRINDDPNERDNWLKRQSAAGAIGNGGSELVGAEEDDE